MGQDSSKWKILESKVVFSSLPWIRLTIQNLRLPDGRIVDDYPKLEFRDYSMIFATKWNFNLCYLIELLHDNRAFNS